MGSCIAALNRRGTLILSGALLVAACTSKVTSEETAADHDALPQPATIVVQDFAIDPNAIHIDMGVGGTIRRALSDTESADARANDIALVRAAVRGGLEQAIAKMGLAVHPVGNPMPAGPYVEIRGTVLTIDEGNRTRRNIVGFGAGKSMVRAKAEVFYVAPNAPARLLESYDARVDSGHMPGLGLGAAAGSVSALAVGGGVKVATAGQAEVESEARKLADRLSVNLGTLFADHHWIPASAIPSTGLLR